MSIHPAPGLSTSQFCHEADGLLLTAVYFVGITIRER